MNRNFKRSGGHTAGHPALPDARTQSLVYLNLVYNPQGPSLPPPQAMLEESYRKHLGERFGIVFNRLHALTNMPIQRFGSLLISKGQFTPYMQLLRHAHQEANLEAVMCRSLISVDWQGYVYDCDFRKLCKSVASKPRRAKPRSESRDISGR